MDFGLKIRKMKKILFLLFIPFLSFGQTATLEDMAISVEEDFYRKDLNTLVLPVVGTNDEVIDRKINAKIRKKIFEEYYSEVAIDSVKENLIKMVEEGLISMKYASTFNKNGILSLQIIEEWIEPVKIIKTVYLNFDLKTGALLKLSDLILEESGEVFKDNVRKMNSAIIEEYEENLGYQLEDEEIDEAAYERAIGAVSKYCRYSVQFGNFMLQNSELEIVNYCKFPEAIKTTAPEVQLTFAYESLKDQLDTEMAKRLLE